jgi:hypothetical protein
MAEGRRESRRRQAADDNEFVDSPKLSPPSHTRVPACCANANMPGDAHAHAGKFQVQGAGRKAIPCRFLSLVIPAHLGPVAACCLPSGRRRYWYCVHGPVAARLAGARADPSTPRSWLLDLPQQYPGVFFVESWNSHKPPSAFASPLFSTRRAHTTQLQAQATQPHRVHSPLSRTQSTSIRYMVPGSYHTTAGFCSPRTEVAQTCMVHAGHAPCCSIQR